MTVLKNKSRGSQAKKKTEDKSRFAGAQPNPLMNWLDNLATQSEMPNAPKELFSVSDNPREMLIKTFFVDEQEANEAVMLLMKFKEFDMPQEFTDMVVDKLAANNSIYGAARKEYLQAWAQVVVERYVAEVAESRRNGGSRKKLKPPKEDEGDED